MKYAFRSRVHNGTKVEPKVAVVVLVYSGWCLFAVICILHGANVTSLHSSQRGEMDRWAGRYMQSAAND